MRKQAKPSMRTIFKGAKKTPNRRTRVGTTRSDAQGDEKMPFVMELRSSLFKQSEVGVVRP
ncbi:hypothetical protein AP057_07960 [Geobacillus sp. Sah69]|nr:hypothetical protein AP057_07960 [Geobacillus sp. Sah69]